MWDQLSPKARQLEQSLRGSVPRHWYNYFLIPLSSLVVINQPIRDIFMVEVPTVAASSGAS